MPATKAKAAFGMKPLKGLKMSFIETWYYEGHLATYYTFKYKNVVFNVDNPYDETKASLSIYYTKNLQQTILEILDIVGIDYTFDYIGPRKYLSSKNGLQSLESEHCLTFTLENDQIINIFRNRVEAAS